MGTKVMVVAEANAARAVKETPVPCDKREITLCRHPPPHIKHEDPVHLRMDGVLSLPLFYIQAGISPSLPISLVISSIRSKGNGGKLRGLMATDMSFIGLSSAATRFDPSFPQRRHRWMIAHSPSFRTHTATASMMPPQSEPRSPGSLSTCKLARQFEQ